MKINKKRKGSGDRTNWYTNTRQYCTPQSLLSIDILLDSIFRITPIKKLTNATIETDCPSPNFYNIQLGFP